jgi:hypothetical protein
VLGALLPDAQLDMRLPERGIQLLDLLEQLPLAAFGPGFPFSAGPCLPLSRNSRFQLEIDCSDAFPWRAASAIKTFPPMTARTSRYLSSTEKTEGRATCSSLHQEADTNPLPDFVTRDIVPGYEPAT